jgi:hypothetical protein
MQEKYPQMERPEALEGTLAHEVAAARFTGIMAGRFDNATIEMLEGADLWEDTFKDLPGKNIEQTTNVNELIWGTPDLWAWNGDTLTVADYKFGHRTVEARMNWQMITYAAGIIYQRKPGKPSFIEMIIVQPRCFHREGPVRRWKISYNEFCGYRQRMLERAEEAVSDNPRAFSGKECMFCTARHACQTLLDSTMTILEYSGQNVPFDLTDEALSKELDLMIFATQLLSARKVGLENEVMARIKMGRRLPGWTVAAGEGREVWARPIAEVVAFGQLMGIDISKADALTPKQAIKKGIPEDLVRMYSKINTGSDKLIQDFGYKAKEVFGNGK